MIHRTKEKKERENPNTIKNQQQQEINLSEKFSSSTFVKKLKKSQSIFTHLNPT